jgi:hypothetical protein
MARVIGPVTVVRAAALLVCSAAVAGVVFAASSYASIRWVGHDYYGINFQQLQDLGPKARAKHIRRIAKLGIHQVRSRSHGRASSPTRR